MLLCYSTFCNCEKHLADNRGHVLSHQHNHEFKGWQPHFFRYMCDTTNGQTGIYHICGPQQLGQEIFIKL